MRNDIWNRLAELAHTLEQIRNYARDVARDPAPEWKEHCLGRIAEMAEQADEQAAAVAESVRAMEGGRNG